MRQVTRALIGFIRGGNHPRSVSWALYLGVLAGFVSGMNLSLAVLLLLVILLDVHTRVFLLAWAGGFALSWPLMPVTFRIGQFLLDRSPLGSQLARLGESPLMALLDWDRYTLVGGVALAALGALPVASAAARFVQSRRDLARQAASVDVDSLATSGVSSAAVKATNRLDAQDEPRWLRPLGPIAFPVAMATMAVILNWMVPGLVGRALLGRFSELNGADVEAATLHLSLSDGRFDLTGLAIADPSQLSFDRLRVERIHGKLHPGALMRGRLEIERIELDGLRSDVARRRPARPLDGHLPAIAAGRFELPSGPLLGRLDPGSDALARANELPVQAYLRSWPRVREQLDLLNALTRQLEALQKADARSSGNLLASGGTANLWARRSPLGQSKPLVRIDRLRADSLPAAWGFGSTATLQLGAVTSHPSLESDPTRLVVVAPQMGTEIDAAFHIQKRGGRHELHFLAHQLDLADLLDRRASRRRFEVRDGTLSVIGTGWFDRQRLELALEVDVDALEVKLLGEQSVAGLTAPMWNEGLRALGRFHGRVVLRGEWQSPELVVDADHLVQQFKHQLRAAGAHGLVDAVELQLAAADKAPLKQGVDVVRHGQSAPGEAPLAPAPADDQLTAGDTVPLDVADRSSSDSVTESMEGDARATAATLAGAQQPQAATDHVWPPRGGEGSDQGPYLPTSQPQPEPSDTSSIADNDPPTDRGVHAQWNAISDGAWPQAIPTAPSTPPGVRSPRPPTQMGWTPPSGSPGSSGPGSTASGPPVTPPSGPIQLRRGYDEVFHPALMGAWQPSTSRPKPASQPGGPNVVSADGLGADGQRPDGQSTGPKGAAAWPTRFAQWVRRVMGTNRQADEGEVAEASPAVGGGRARPRRRLFSRHPQQPAQEMVQRPAEQTVRRYEPGLEHWYEQLWR